MTGYEKEFYNKTNLDFNEFYLKHQPKLQKYICKFHINELDAGDIVNQGFLKILECLEQYNPEYSIATWLYSITKNIAILYKRKNSNTIIVDMQAGDNIYNDDNISDISNALLQKEVVDKLMSEVDDSEENIRYENIIHDKYSHTLNEIMNLSPMYKEYIVLSDVESLQYKEISSKLETKNQTVKNRSTVRDEVGTVLNRQ